MTKPLLEFRLATIAQDIRQAAELPPRDMRKVLTLLADELHNEAICIGAARVALNDVLGDADG